MDWGRIPKGSIGGGNHKRCVCFRQPGSSWYNLIISVPSCGGTYIILGPINWTQILLLPQCQQSRRLKGIEDNHTITNCEQYKNYYIKVTRWPEKWKWLHRGGDIFFWHLKMSWISTRDEKRKRKRDEALSRRQSLTLAENPLRVRNISLSPLYL